MAQNKQPADKSRFGHWVRVIVSLLSMGFIYPNVMTEDEETPKDGADAKAGVKGH
ncbi:MAG: hypothetical protein LLG93_04265 [Deltaproteobacteria bacterium]|nr:hypothetical protein [Deltaproteobacteria bacterium]